MCNVGDIVEFILENAPPDGGGYAFVWKWWDGTVDATRIPSVSKGINVGGGLSYQLIQSDEFGRSIIYNGSITVNFPPVVIGAPSISENDAPFPFTTILSSTSYDPEHPGGTELSFAWYDGPTLISTGTTTVPSTGTYANHLQLISVGSNRTLTQAITDTSNGITRINYYVRGFEPSGLVASSASISNSLISAANNQIVIGPGVDASFTAYAQDTLPGQLTFLWFAGTLDGWSKAISISDVPPLLPNGLFKSQITLPLQAESPGLKTIDVTITNAVTQSNITLTNTVNLIAAQPPTITSISTDAPIINGGCAVSQAGFVHFSANASDPNNALLSYKWTFSQPAGVTLYGRTVMIRPSDYDAFAESGLESGGPLPIIGQVTVTDRYSQTSTVSLNQFITTLVWPSTQVSPQTSGTGSTSLQKRYWGVLSSPTVGLNDLPGFSSDFSSQRNQSDTISAANQYLYLIYPAVFGQGIITINGAVSNSMLLTVASFNGISYNIYRTSTAVSGNFVVVVS